MRLSAKMVLVLVSLMWLFILTLSIPIRTTSIRSPAFPPHQANLSNPMSAQQSMSQTTKLSIDISIGSRSFANTSTSYVLTIGANRPVMAALDSNRSDDSAASNSLASTSSAFSALESDIFSAGLTEPTNPSEISFPESSLKSKPSFSTSSKSQGNKSTQQPILEKYKLVNYFSDVRQGFVGDCAIVSSLDALDNSTFGRSLVKKSICINQKTNQAVLQFQNGTNIQITEQDVDFGNRNKGLTGDKLARIFETGLQIDAFNKGATPNDGGWAYNYLDVLTGFPKYETFNLEPDKIKQLLIEHAEYIKNGQGAIITADFSIATPQSNVIGKGRHSYAIHNIDLAKNEVELSNPNNTELTSSISLDRFATTVRQITYVDEAAQSVVRVWR